MMQTRSVTSTPSRPRPLHRLAGLLLAGCAGLAAAHAQSSDALLDKLVEKGILTVKEADDLRAETDKNFTTAYAVKSGLPEWVKSLKIHGDFRGRYEGFFRDDAAFVDRHRFRYRLRAGLTAVMADDFEVGIRLTSSEPSAGFGGDPISGNASFSSGGSKKFVYLDLAYAKWNPIHTADWSGTFTLGKMENPFTFPSTMVFDKDYTPEGAAFEVSHRFSPDQTFKLTGAAYLLSEIGASSNDPVLAGTQARWDGRWSPTWSSTLGAGFFAISGRSGLNTAAVPNQGFGNTRTAAGDLVYHYNPFYADAGLTHTLERVPHYPGPFPIALSGDFLHNPATSQDNQGYSVGLNFGKAGKKGTWELNYRWTELQADAWYEECPESDFGAFYLTAPVGGGAGYRNGTNVRGHWVKGSFSPYDSLTLSVAYFLTENVKTSPAGSGSSIGRLQVDAQYKF